MDRPTAADLGHDLDLGLFCETCESEIDLLDDAPDRGVCRHCGIAFRFDAPAALRRAG